MRLALRLAADLYAGRAASMRPTGLRQDRRGEGDVDGQAAAGPGFRGDGGAVGGGDSPDDGQAEAVGAAAAGGGAPGGGGGGGGRAAGRAGTGGRRRRPG